MPVVYSNKKFSYRYSVIIRKSGKEPSCVYQAHAYARNAYGTAFHGKCFDTLLESFLDITDQVLTVEYGYDDFEDRSLKSDLSTLINWIRYDNQWTQGTKTPR